MKALSLLVSLMLLCGPASAGILCTGLDEGIEEFHLGYSHIKGCFMTLKKTDDTDFITKVIDPNTSKAKFDCKETIVGNQVITEATVVIDPALVEPGETYPEMSIKTKGGTSNFELTFVFVPGELEWTFTNLSCQQVADLE